MTTPIHTDLHRIVLTAVIYDDQGRFLITKRSEHKKVHPGKWTIPGGGLETTDYIDTPPDRDNGWGGVLEKALLRELKEEVGIEVGDFVMFGHTTFIRPDGIPVLILKYYCKYKGGEIVLDEDSIEFAWVSANNFDQYDLIGGVLKDLLEAKELM